MKRKLEKYIKEERKKIIREEYLFQMIVYCILMFLLILFGKSWVTALLAIILGVLSAFSGLKYIILNEFKGEK